MAEPSAAQQRNNQAIATSMVPEPQPAAAPAAQSSGSSATVTQGGTVYAGVGNQQALKQDEAGKTQLYQLDASTGQLVPAGSSGTAGDKGYYTVDTAATANLANTAASTASTTATNNGDLQSASATLSSWMGGIPGLSALDPSGMLAGWVNSEANTLAGQGMSAADITSQIESTINNPSGNPGAQQVFDQLFPGYNQKIQNGTSNANGQYTGISGYIAYASQLNAYAQTAGLTPGTMSPQAIGELWQNNISASEVSSRITQGYVVANQAWQNLPGFADYMQSQGVSQGDLASYFLAPDNATADKQLQQTLNAGLATGAAQQTGFGSISAAQAASLSAFLSQSNQSGMGGYGAVTATGAENALNSGLGSGQASAAAMAQAGFEGALPGQVAGGPGVVSQDQILGAVEGNAADVQATRRATETRSAGAQGGGGYTSTAQGATGLGYGSQA